MSEKDSRLPVFVVSMLSSIERRESIGKQLAGYDGSWLFVDAIVPGDSSGTTWTPQDGYRSRLILGRSITKGEFGCALSHLEIYKRVALGEHEAAIVLEDDAIITGDLFRVCETAMKVVNFDVLLLGYSKVRASNQCIRNIEEPMIGIAEILGRRLGRAYRERRCGTVAYLVTKEGARKLQSIQGEVVTVADDWPYFRQHGLNIVHVRPSVVLEDFYTTASSIADERLLAEKKWNRNFQILRQIARVARGLIWSIRLRLSHLSKN